LASRGITVNCVAPGFIETDMTKALNEDQAKQISMQIPLGKMGNVSDVADAVLYLVKAAYVTGQVLHVNGGMYMN
jgi:3-oxoacyl-[acyl-carrier protein] reductase